MYKKYTKHVMDFIFAVAGLIFLMIILSLIAIVIKVDSRGPILFKQIRVGQNREHFYIYKFRTMYVDTPKDTPTHLLVNPDSFITRAGKLLRKTSLDELPQLINILKGEMSFIGPRPALWNQYDLIEEREKYQANAVRPGITGLAQVNGRDVLSIEQKAFMDGEYASHITLKSDVKCFLKTVIFVAQRKGIVEGDSDTDPSRHTLTIK